MAKTWIEKMADKPTMPKVLKLEKNWPCYNAVHAMGADIGDPVVLVNASEILPIMAKVPKGKLITIWEICENIAKKHKVKACCSLVSGIHVMIIANAVEEAIAKHDKSELTKVPYWRTVKAKGELNPKYPGGLAGHAKLLEKEGFEINKKDRKWFVKDWDKFIMV